MDFENLPDNFFLRVFRQLPFKQQCRIGALSRSFRRMSKISAVSRTKSLQLGGPEFTNLPDNSLSKIFDLCRESLEHVRLPGKFIATFAEFSLPRLTRILLRLDGDHGFDWVEVILANNLALKELSLVLFENRSGQLVSTGVTFANLTRLEVYPSGGTDVVDGKILRLLSGRCPNLKHLLLRCKWHDEAQAAFEEFFARCSILETLDFGYDRVGLNFLEMKSMWRMESLQDLIIPYVSDYIALRGDDFLVKVASSFHRLQTLEVYSLRMTNRGVGALASLENLAVLTLPSDHTYDVEASLFRLAQKGKIQKAYLKCWVTPSTFLTIVTKCPNLDTLYLNGVRNIETPDAAAQLLTSLGRWNKKRNLWFHFYVQMQVWRSLQVESALKNLKETAEVNVGIDTSESW